MALFLFSRRGSYQKNTPLSLDTDLREASVFRLHPVVQGARDDSTQEILQGPEQSNFCFCSYHLISSLEEMKEPSGAKLARVGQKV